MNDRRYKKTKTKTKTIDSDNNACVENGIGIPAQSDRQLGGIIARLNWGQGFAWTEQTLGSGKISTPV